MRRVVVTGMGIVSSIGNNTSEVLESLRTATPGIVFAEEYAKLALAIVENPMLNGQCLRLDAGQRFAPK